MTRCAEKKYHHVLKGYNFRLEGNQGAVLGVRLRHLERWTEARRTAAAHYHRLLAGSGTPTPATNPHVRHVYAIRAHEWQKALQIQTGIHYPIPVHVLPAFSDLGYEEGRYPHSDEAAAREVLSLSMFPEPTQVHCEEVCRALRSLVAAGSDTSVASA